MGKGVPSGKGRLGWKLGGGGRDGDRDEPDLELCGLPGPNLCWPPPLLVAALSLPPVLRPPFGQERPERLERGRWEHGASKSARPQTRRSLSLCCLKTQRE